MDLKDLDINTLYITPIAETIASDKMTKKLLKLTQNSSLINSKINLFSVKCQKVKKRREISNKSYKEKRKRVN
jgi:hypothetical protein